MRFSFRWGWAPVLAGLLAACSGGVSEGPAPVPAQQLLSVAASAFTGHGTWWNPAEPGSGFVFEAQGNTGVITYFTYEASGKPVWVSGAGAFQLRDDGKYAFSATLFRYSGGQGAGSDTPRTPTRVEVGTTTVVFNGDTAHVQVPGRTYTARKFNATTASGGVQPEAGIYWNPDQSGRGYTMEVANNVVSIGVFHYDAAGEPTWNLVVGDMATGRLAAPFTSYFGGQTLGGAYKAPQAVSTLQQFQANFGNACRGEIRFPGMAPVAVTRFPFGGLAAGGECRSSSTVHTGSCTAGVAQGFRGNIETVLADAGYAGGDGGAGSGDGGGAAAGGGLGKVLGGLMRVTDLSDGSVVGEAVTDASNGLVTIKTCGKAGPFLLTLEGRAGAKYYDEGLNQLTDFGPGRSLHALVDKWDEHVGVSPLTEAAYRYAIHQFLRDPADVASGRVALVTSGSAQGLTASQVRAANQAVLDQVNGVITSNYQLVSAKSLPTPIDAGSSASALPASRYGRSAVLNGGLVKASKEYNGQLAAPALALAEGLARDLTDGRIDGFALDKTAASQTANAAYDTRRLALAVTHGTDAVARTFSATTLAPAAPDFMEGTLLLEYYKDDPASPDTGFFLPDKQTDANRYKDTVILLSDGTVDVYRSIGGQRSVHRRFLSGVKQLFYRDPAYGGAVNPFQGIYALKNDGTVWTWGSNVYCGEFYLAGTNAYLDSLRRVQPGAGYSLSTPVQVQGLSNVTSMTMQMYGDTVLARTAGGEVFLWGRDYTQVARDASASWLTSHWDITKPAPRTCVPMVTRVNGLSNVARVFSSVNAHFALTFAGDVYSWGSGLETGQGVEEGTFVPQPRWLPTLQKVRELAIIPGQAGPNIFAISSDLYYWIWGYQRGLSSKVPYGIEFASGRAATVKEMAPVGSLKGAAYLYADGTVSFFDPNAGGNDRDLAVPLARHLHSTGDDVWIYTFDGRVYAFGANYPTATDISGVLRNGP